MRPKIGDKVWVLDDILGDPVGMTGTVVECNDFDCTIEPEYCKGCRRIFGWGNVYKNKLEYLEIQKHELQHKIKRIEEEISYENQQG